MKFYDIAQNTDEWLQLRAGRVGGSTIGKIMANYGKAMGQPAHDAAVRIALEKIKGKPQESNYANAHMERGHEQEPIARQLYEEMAFCEVLNGGYFTNGDGIGVSPDGLVGRSGLIEIKSVIDTVHFKTVKRNAPDPKYKWQLCFNLKCTGRDWIDYIEFCSGFPEGKRLFVHRLKKSDCKEEFKMINSRMKEFTKLVKDKIKIIKAA